MEVTRSPAVFVDTEVLDAFKTFDSMFRPGAFLPTVSLQELAQNAHSSVTLRPAVLGGFLE